MWRTRTIEKRHRLHPRSLFVDHSPDVENGCPESSAPHSILARLLGTFSQRSSAQGPPCASKITRTDKAATKSSESHHIDRPTNSPAIPAVWQLHSVRSLSIPPSRCSPHLHSSKMTAFTNSSSSELTLGVLCADSELRNGLVGPASCQH